MSKSEVSLEEPMNKMNLDDSSNLEEKLELCKRRSITYIEKTVSHAEEIPLPEGNKPFGCHFSTSLDTAFVLPLLKKIPDFTHEVLSCMAEFVNAEKLASGYWNDRVNRPVLSNPPGGKRVVHGDVDDTSLAIMALYKTGINDFKSSQTMAMKMLDDIVITDHNLCSSLIISQESPDRVDTWKKMPMNSNVDISVLANLLFCVGSLKLDNDPRLETTLDFVTDIVENLDEKIANFELPSHCNKNFLLYLLSRAVSSSEVIREKFGRELAKCITRELRGIDPENCELGTLSLVSLLLAILRLRLHDNVNKYVIILSPDVNEIREKVLCLAQVLLQKQSQDGFFEDKTIPETKETTFRQDKMYYSGNAVITVLALSVIHIVTNEIQNLRDRLMAWKTKKEYEKEKVERQKEKEEREKEKEEREKEKVEKEKENVEREKEKSNC